MSKVYLDIDSLLDTRYPIVKPFLNGDKYVGRLCDNFSTLSYKSFRLLYGLRNIRTLLDSDVSCIIEEVNGLYLYKHKEHIMNHVVEDIVLEINMFPYEMQKEAIEIFEKKFQQLFPQYKVELKYFEPDERILKDYYAIVMYDGMLFLDKMMANKELKDSPKSDVVLITSLQVGKHVKDIGEYAKSITNSYEPYINLQLIPLLMFSSHNAEH